MTVWTAVLPGTHETKVAFVVSVSHHAAVSAGAGRGAALLRARSPDDAPRPARHALGRSARLVHIQVQ